MKKNTKDKKVRARITEAQMKKLDILAQKLGVNTSAVIRQMIDSFDEQQTLRHPG